MSLIIAFIGSTNFLCFPTGTGRRLQPPSFSSYNLREDLTPLFSGYNQKEATTPMFFSYNWKVATTPCPFPVQPPRCISIMMEPLSHYHCEIYYCKRVPINLHQTTCTNNLNHASTYTSTCTINKCINHASTCTKQHVINLYHKQVHQPCTNL